MDNAIVAACEFTFQPVNVSRGRKFRGFAYFICSYDASFAVYRGRGGYIQNEKAKLWDPVTEQFVYATADFCDDVEQDESITLEAKRKFIEKTIKSTVDWCASKNPSAPEAEIKRFARNVLRKHYPGMAPAIDEALPDQRDIAEEIQKTVSWAITLVTKPCNMYGKYCPGGKPLPPKKKVEIAYKALQKKGIASNPQFHDVWNMVLTVFGLPTNVVG